MKYGFIGCGNMGSALARAVSKATKDIMLADFAPEKAEKLAFDLGCTAGDNNLITKHCERIFLGVKPQVIKEMLAGISEGLKAEKPLLITMAAGVKISSIESALGFSLPIIRIMPNTPVSVGKGMILYCRNALVTDQMLDDFVNDMRFSGILDLIDEELIDAGCSLSGCGPAYMFMFIDALAEGAVECGLSRDKAVKYATATMLGSAELLLNSDKTPEELKQAVCSPGGSTLMGVKALEEGNLIAACKNAVEAAFKRNKELGK